MSIDWRRLIPLYWLQNYPTSRRWDAALNAALDAGDIEKAGLYVVRIGAFKVWIENWPYAYGSPYEDGEKVDVLPTVKTRRRLRSMVKGDDALDVYLRRKGVTP